MTRRLAAALLLLATSLACSGLPISDGTVEPVDDVEPVDTGTEEDPDPEPDPDPDPVGGGPTGDSIRCLSVDGEDIDADARLVYEGKEVIGGSLTWVQDGTSRIAEPLTGAKKGRTMTATGPILDTDDEVTLELNSKGRGNLVMTIDGTEIDGEVDAGPCEGD